MTILIRDADLDSPADAAAVVGLIDEYARGAGGQSRPLTEEAQLRLVPGLRGHPSAFVLLACEGEERVGVAVCFWGFSTFAGRPFVNIHDLSVAANRRSRGVGSALIAEVLRRARDRHSSKITLEVHDHNEGAKRLYERMGFGPWNPATLSVTRNLGTD